MANKKETFTGQLGFIMAAAASAVGLGNIWRFPYLAAKDGGGIFVFIYLILTVTFGFALLTTEIAIGRKTGEGSLLAYGKLKKGWGFLGYIASFVVVIILPYYIAIGGWILKFLAIYLTGKGKAATDDSYFTSYIAKQWEPLIWMVIFFVLTAVVIYAGVQKGIEKFSKILMPILIVMVIGISFFSLTLKHTDEFGVTRTGLEGFKVYVKPDISGMSFGDIMQVILDAMGQLFFSISVAMGIMVTYGSYSPKEANLVKSVNNIEIFDTLVAFLAGMMIVPAVYTFQGTEGMDRGAGLIFISLPKVFDAMGPVGNILAPVFFLIVLFAALTSCISVYETVNTGFADMTKMSRRKSLIFTSIYALVAGVIICLGYNVLKFNITLPDGSKDKQLLDVFDYISNSFLMPMVALLTSILIGWITKPKLVIDEVTDNGKIPFRRKTLYIVMIKFVAPLMLIALLLQAFGIL